MKHKIDVRSLVLGAFLGAGIMFSVAATIGRTTWDYKIISGRILGVSGHSPLSQQLDQASTDGWEVVSTASDDGYPFVILRRAR